MTTPSALDPAVEEVLFDLARKRDRTLFVWSPDKLARALAGVHEVIDASRTGLLPVEQHLLATMREEVLDLLLRAARESMQESEASQIIALQPREPHAHWRSAVDQVLVCDDESLQPPFTCLKSLRRAPRFDANMAQVAVAAARQLSDSPRTRLYSAWDQVQRGAWTSALNTANELLSDSLSFEHRRAALQVAYIAFGSLGDDHLALRACVASRRASERLAEAAPYRAVLEANVLVFALRSGEVTHAEDAARKLHSLDEPECTAALRDIAKAVRRSVREFGSGAGFDRTFAHRLGADSNDVIREVCLALD